MATAKATGTLKNTGNINSTFGVYLEVIKSDTQFGGEMTYSSAAQRYAIALNFNETSPQITIPSLNGLDVGGMVGQSFKARVVVDLLAPEDKLAVLTTPWIDISGVAPIYSATWTGTPAIGRSGAIQGDGVIGNFQIGLDVSRRPFVSYKWLVVGAIGVVAYYFLVARKKKK